jgi:hypothetical protein
MAGRGPQSFKKLQREQQQKEKHQERLAKRLHRKQEKRAPLPPAPVPVGSETK